jgi:integrase
VATTSGRLRSCCARSRTLTTTSPLGKVQKVVTVLKHALRLAVEWDLLHANAAQVVKLRRSPPKAEYVISLGELKSVIAAAAEGMRPPIALAPFTGIRRGELLSLRWLAKNSSCRSDP